jgi:hypothetical protein
MTTASNVIEMHPKCDECGACSPLFKRPKRCRDCDVWLCVFCEVDHACMDDPDEEVHRALGELIELEKK